MVTLVYKLTGGRPMKYSKDFSFDCFFWDPVDLYEDAFGRKWFARGPWDLKRFKAS